MIIHCFQFFYPKVLNLNRLLPKLNWLLCNYGSVLHVHRLQLAEVEPSSIILSLFHFNHTEMKQNMVNN